MRKIEAQRIRAYRAVTWYQRLEEDLTQADLQRFLRWLRASPANARAMLLLERIGNSLRR